MTKKNYTSPLKSIRFVAKALQPNAKCPALGSSCLAEGLAQGCRAENGGKFLLFGDAKWLVATRFYGE